MAERSPKPPAGLAAAGRALWGSMRAALADGFDFDERELAILGMACGRLMMSPRWRSRSGITA